MLTSGAGYHPTLGNWRPSTLPALLPSVLAWEVRGTVSQASRPRPNGKGLAGPSAATTGAGSQGHGRRGPGHHQLTDELGGLPASAQAGATPVLSPHGALPSSVPPPVCPSQHAYHRAEPHSTLKDTGPVARVKKAFISEFLSARTTPLPPAQPAWLYPTPLLTLGPASPAQGVTTGSPCPRKTLVTKQGHE